MVVTKKNKTLAPKFNKSQAMKYVKALGDDASIVENGTIYDITSLIDTGSYLLNAQVSKSIYGGIASNRIMSLAGEESTGKTFLLLGIIKHYLEQNPDAMVVFFESEGAVNKETIESRGIDSSRVILKPVISVENFKKTCTKFIKDYTADPKDERIPIFMCLDSLGMLPSEKEVQDAQDGKDKSDMTRPKVIKSIFRILTVALAKANIPLIVTNHVYATMEIYGKPEMGGGSGLKYAGSLILYLSKAQYKEKDENTKKEDHAGILVTSYTHKSRETREKKKVKFVIHADYGIDRFSGLFEFCVDTGLILKTGNRWYWASEGEETATYQKTINRDPSSFFNKKRLDEIDIMCNKYFGYGKGEKSAFDTDTFHDDSEDDETED